MTSQEDFDKFFKKHSMTEKELLQSVQIPAELLQLSSETAPKKKYSKIAVVCKNKREFEHFCRERGWPTHSPHIRVINLETPLSIGADPKFFDYIFFTEYAFENCRYPFAEPFLRNHGWFDFKNPEKDPVV